MVVVKQRRMSGEVGDAAPPSLLSSLVLGDGVAICKLQLRAPEISFKISVPFFIFFFGVQTIITTCNCFPSKEQFATERFATMMLIGGAVAVRVQVFWPKIVLKKWLNLKSKDLDFGADEDEDDDDGSDIDDQGWSNLPLH